ncbi:nucleotidyl transferase AbiEii/AbiGii toxin family protein [Kribbella sp. NPDC020789]
MKPEHEEPVRIALSTLRDRGYALAGGNALTVHGIGDRASDDVDLFTNRMTDDVGAAAQQVRSALEERGHSVTIEQQGVHSSLLIGAGDQQFSMDLGIDYRTREPVESAVGPVLHVDDAVGSKIASIYTRGEAKDFVDANAALRAGYSTDQLMRLADAREASPIDRPTFGQLLDSARHIPDREYAKYGLGPEETAGLKARMSGWADELRTRAANPDIDKSLGLVEGGKALPSQERTGAAGGGVHRRSPYEQGREKGERGS